MERIGGVFVRDEMPTLAEEIKLPNATGLLPTIIVAETVFVEVFITLIVLVPEFATYTLLPSGLTDTPTGCKPTIIVVKTVSALASITLSVLSWLCVT